VTDAAIENEQARASIISSGVGGSASGREPRRIYVGFDGEWPIQGWNLSRAIINYSLVELENRVI
jgi:hypothetical protein